MSSAISYYRMGITEYQKTPKISGSDSGIGSMIIFLSAEGVGGGYSVTTFSISPSAKPAASSSVN